MSDAPPSGGTTGTEPRRAAGRAGGRLWKAALGIVVSIGLLWWALRDVEDPRAVAREVARADPLLLLLAVAAGTAVFWIRAWRWRSILEPVRPGTSFRSRFGATNIGFMMNNVVGLRTGEFARPFVLSRLEPVPLVAAFSTLVIERLFDGLVVVVFLFAAMSLPGFPDVQVSGGVDFRAVARMLTFVLLVGVAILFLLVLFPVPATRVMERVAAKVLPSALRRPFVDALEAFLAGVRILRDPILLSRATFWSVMHWGVNALGFYLGMLAFGIDLPYTAAVFLQSCVALAVSLPSGPGFFGPFEAAAKLVLVDMWGGDPSKAVGFALGFHIAAFFPITIMGLYYAWSMGFSLRGMARAEEVVETAVERESGVDPDDPDAAHVRPAGR